MGLRDSASNPNQKDALIIFRFNFENLLGLKQTQWKKRQKALNITSSKKYQI